MKPILALVFLFSCLFVAHKVYPYQAPCEQTQPVQNVEENANIAKYTLEDHQVARYESGEAYDFSHDLNFPLDDEPVLSDGIFEDDLSEIEPCLNCSNDFYLIDDDFDEIRDRVINRMNALKTYRYSPSLYEDDEWKPSADRYPKFGAAP